MHEFIQTGVDRWPFAKNCIMLSQNVYVKISVFVQVQCDQCVFTVLFYGLSGILLGILPIEFCHFVFLPYVVGFCMRGCG